MEKKRSISRYIILIAIVALGFLLRIFKLGEVPVSLSWDEAAIGYNAYSIVQTGKDEYGTAWPLLFKSFNDYKLPGYVYSTALSIKLLGLSDFAVRLPSALFGTLTILAFYFLLRSLMLKEWQVLFGSLLFAISPWHLQFSRAAFEANGSLFFVVAGFASLFAARKHPKLYIFSGICLVLSVYFYYTARILVPLLLIVYAQFYRKELSKAKKWVLSGVVIGMLLLIPILPKLIGESNTRIGQVSIFTDEATTNDYVLALARNPNTLWAKLFYNRRIGYVYRFVENYVKNNSLEFLFVRGDPYPRHHVSGMGYLYAWELPFLLIGIVSLFLKRTKEGLFILAWWLLGAIPASFTTGSPHGLRTLATLPAFIILTAKGTFVVLEWLKKQYKTLFVVCLSIITAGFFVAYLIYYFDYPPRHTPNFWGDGHKYLFARVEKLKLQYHQIVVTGANFKPYIYALYYTQYDPASYQKIGTEHGFDAYAFTSASWEDVAVTLERNPKGKTLFVRTPAEADSSKPVMEEIKDSFGTVVFVLQEG